jgi:hypothetical protein
MHFGKRTPLLVVRRAVKIASALEARKAAATRVSLGAIMVKAYALTADAFPELRQVYLKYPLPHMYEYPESFANVTIERVVDGEQVVLGRLIRNPSALPLTEIDRILKHANTAPLTEIKDFALSLRVARMPLLVRRALWWLALNIGRKRANFLGTFGMSAMPLRNFEGIYSPTSWTTLVGYSFGMLDSEDSLIVILLCDHRVIDAAQSARILAKLEAVLADAIVKELQAERRSSEA